MRMYPLSSIRGWLLFLFIGTTLGFAVLGGISVASSQHGNSAIRSLYADQVVPLRLLKILTQAYGIQVQTAVVRLNSGEITTEEGLQAISEARDSIFHGYRQYKSSKHDPVTAELLPHLDTAMYYADIEIEGLLHYLEIQQGLGNRMLANQLDPMIGSLGPSSRPVVSLLDSLSRLHLGKAQSEYKKAESLSQSLLYISLGIVVAGLLFGPLVGLRTLHRIGNQLNAILPVLQKLGEGDLTAMVHSKSKDELGSIANGLDGMTKNLRILVEQMGADATILSQTSLDLGSVAEHVLADAKANMNLTKQAALQTRDAATKLEVAIQAIDLAEETLNGPNGTSLRVPRNAILSMRNENMIAIVRALTELRATSVQSTRGVDGVRHKAGLLGQMARRLSDHMGRFRV